MNYLLDTCLLSELFKNQPDGGVRQWIEKIEDKNLYLSVLSIGEIQKGVAKLENGQRKNAIQVWLDSDLILRFGSRIIPIDQNIIVEWGLLTGNFEKKGRSLPVIDCLLAATAISLNLTIVTRNTSDFIDLPVKLINPWA